LDEICVLHEEAVRAFQRQERLDVETREEAAAVPVNLLRVRAISVAAERSSALSEVVLRDKLLHGLLEEGLGE
jgi:hypothetical protein